LRDETVTLYFRGGGIKKGVGESEDRVLYVSIVVKIKGNILAILSESVIACSNYPNCGLPALLL
jgi:hypothetical protein